MLARSRQIDAARPESGEINVFIQNINFYVILYIETWSKMDYIFFLLFKEKRIQSAYLILANFFQFVLILWFQGPTSFHVVLVKVTEFNLKFYHKH